jgi:glyoxylase-like metal-dependent hydrolase (beta-lactamase superfamily II)
VSNTRAIFSDGGLRVDIVSDGIYRNDGGAMFGVVPRTLWSQYVTPDEKNRVPLALNCLLVRDGATTVLIDTGYGTKLGEKGLAHFDLDPARPGLPAALQSLGIAPEDVDLVINTHLHGDHCGWNTTVSEGRATPTFPNARYIAQRDEYAAARYPNERTRATYFLDNYLPLEEARVLDLVDGDVRVTEHIRTVVTPGHTLRHQCVIIAPPGAAPIVFLADLAPRAVHLERTAWVPAVDVYPLDSLVTKRTMARWIVEHDAVCVFEHDDVTPVGRLEPDGERYRVVPVESVTSR